MQETRIKLPIVKHPGAKWILAGMFVFLTFTFLPTVAQAHWLASGLKGRTFVQRFASPRGVFPGPVSPPWEPIYLQLAIPSAIHVFSANSGRFIRTVHTDALGRFRTVLPPGLYRLQPAGIIGGATETPTGTVFTSYLTAPAQTIRVRPHRFAYTTFVYRETLPGVVAVPRGVFPGPAAP